MMLVSLRVQLLVSFLFAVSLPALFRFPDLNASSEQISPLFNSVVGAAVAVLLGLLLFRRVTAFPGTRAFGYIIPSFASSFGVVVLGMFALRLDYSLFYLSASFVLALAVTYLISFLIERYVRQRFWVVPFGDIETLLQIGGVDWMVLHEPQLPAMSKAPIVADLRYDHDPVWERLLAEAAIGGLPVYHTKQLRESLTGRVSIEHLSENSLGSLMPNLAYAKIKRLLDLFAAILILPLLLLPMLAIALAIRLDSKGPIIFRQERMGYRGRVFAMYKFRTMHPRDAPVDDEDARLDAVTQAEDSRITRAGRFLRHVRLDELPQIFNVLRGEMSLIGPRPEAIALSKWYAMKLPFYAYRHIVRPGITGWAQVHQGHVTDLSAVDQKLNYDFYYVKNFSAWIDILIALKTIPTILFGFGSK